MANKVTFDVTTTPYKTIFVTEAPTVINGEPTIELDVKIDLFSDGKEDWLADSGLRKHTFPISSVGGDPLPGSKALGATFFIRNDWKIKPYEASHVLAVNGNFFSEDGTDPFVNVDGSYTVRIRQSVSSLVDSTVQQLSEIEFASFGDGVTIDEINGVSGTEYPTGTIREPVNNLDDAILIAQERGIATFFVLGNLQVVDQDVQRYTFIGESHNSTLITVEAAANALDTHFENATITGELDGEATFFNCIIDSVNLFEGEITQCGLKGVLGLTGDDLVLLIDCYEAGEDQQHPILDLGGDGPELLIHKYTGDLGIQNKTGDAPFRMHLSSGTLITYPTLAGTGDVSVAGNGSILDLGSACSVDSIKLVKGEDLDLIRRLEEADAYYDAATQEMHYYEKGTNIDIIPPKVVTGAEITQDVTVEE